MKKLVILISGQGSNLQALIDHCQQGSIPAQIQAVISDQAAAYGLVRAQQAGIPSVIIRRSPSLTRVQYDQLLAETVAAYQPDLVVLAGFMHILGPNFLQAFSQQILNIHPSLLPKYPGLNTHQQVLANQDTYHGATVHFVTEQLDAGPVILQARIAVSPQETLDSLRFRIQQQEWVIYPLAVRWFIEGRLVMRHGSAWLDQQRLPSTGYPFPVDLSLAEN
ncbi:MAG: phosphoribosylglycinamide formyltransferase [Candidatus Symbiodolus clandestinus]